jgi:hypothetical protein
MIPDSAWADKKQTGRRGWSMAHLVAVAVPDWPRKTLCNMHIDMAIIVRAGTGKWLCPNCKDRAQRGYHYDGMERAA